MKKYYLDKEGVIRILLKTSSKIRNNTNNRINIEDVIDLETEQTIKKVQNPNKFVTTQAVVDYTKSEIDAALENKQDVIQDLAAIRSGANAGATAIQPDDEDYTKLQEQVAKLEDTAVRTGSYDATVAVGLADNLRGDTIVDAEFYKRKTGGTQSVGSGIAAIKEVRGKSIVWNQLLKEGKLVDMGLPSGTLWASCNIDITQPDGFAASPFQYECSFFSWGNVDGHNPISNSEFDYNWGSVNSDDPYYEGQVYGETDGSTLTDNIPVGEAFDAARKNSGAPWRMPTSVEFKELFDNSKFIDANGDEIASSVTDKRVTVNDILGIYIESNLNGSRLFFSCSGYGYARLWSTCGSNGYYWSSTWTSARNARFLSFNSGGVYPQNNNNRYSGRALRPVLTHKLTPETDGNGHKFIQYGDNITDLTLMYGKGNEPASVDDFVKLYPLNRYTYNKGEVIPFAGQNLVTTGKNQYNPATGKANLLGGQQYQISGTYIKIYPTVSLVDYTYGSPVESGTYYTNANSHYVGIKAVSAYDNTKTYTLGSYCINNDTVYKANVAIETAEEFDSTKWDVLTDVAAMVSEGIFTLWDIVPDANGLFTLTKDTEVTIVGGNDTDTMIAIYDGENSAYEPYEKHTLPLDPSQWRDKQGNLVFPYGGMHGVGTAYDYAKVDADGYIRKAVRVFEQVDLGSLKNWYTGADGSIPFVYTKVPNGKTASTNFTASTLALDNIGQNTNKVGIGNHLSQLRVRLDPNGTTLQNLGNRLQGVMLIFELAEPIEVELATPIYAKYLVDKDGTEEITPANGTTPYTTPANLSILYAMDARGKIKNLPKNYLSKESAENMLNAMVSAGIITSYTMTYDAANGRYAFVITKPA